ncbi:hypothetical protein LINGRAHAP2_LOCUS30444 [Linum grandiflorum]
MPASTAATIQPLSRYRPPKPKASSIAKHQVCFSFAAYAKKLINYLKSLHIPIHPGLTHPEFSDLESRLNFSFPPDLRSILQEGLPFGPNFPNWRSSSLYHLLILPVSNLSDNIRFNHFWVDSWGTRPADSSQLKETAKTLLDSAPPLVPIYRNCYIPVSPAAAGNPVFYVDDKVVRILSFDIFGFFQRNKFIDSDLKITLPAWAATRAREIEFWTEAAKTEKRATEGGGTMKLAVCLEEVFWRSRDGGWKEEEVREMMIMDGCNLPADGALMNNKKEDVVCHMRITSARELVRSAAIRKCSPTTTFDFQTPNGCWIQIGGEGMRKKSLGDFINIHYIEV